MGHRLTFHKGQCYNLHGHNYKVELELEGETDKNGFIIDFDDLDNILSPVIGKLDHSLWIYSGDKILTQLIKSDVLKEKPFKYNIMDEESTCENIAKWMHGQIIKLFSNNKNIKNISIKIWETSNSFAVYNGK